MLGGYTASGAVLKAAFVLRGRQRGALSRACRSRAPPPGRVSPGAGSSSREASAKDGASRGTHSSSTSERGAGRSVAGPTPREHLGVTSLAGVVYAVGGRTAGLDTNLLHFESFRPGDRAWRRLQPVPDARGGTGAAGLAGQIVSVGGEEPGGTIAEVLAYRVAERRWLRLEDLPTPRHGVGVAALAGRVFVIGGGPEPGPYGELGERGSTRRAVDVPLHGEGRDSSGSSRGGRHDVTS